MPRRSSGGGGLKLPESLQICIAPTRRRLQHQRHHHSSLREERKASFRSNNWIKKEKCKVTLPTLKVSVLQPVKNSIVDKLKGAWSRMKLVAVSLKKTVPAASTSQKKSAAVLMSHQGVAALGGYTQLNSTYPEDAVADCIQFIKQSSVQL